MIAGLIASLLLTAGLCAGASNTYTYRGNPFTLVIAPYTTSDFVSGSITLNAPLPANLPLQEIDANSVSTYSFSDGVNIWDPADSHIFAIGLSTDSNGVITGWGIGIDGTAGMVSNGVLYVVSEEGESFDEAYPQPGTYGFNSSAPGTWSTSIDCSALTVAPAQFTFGQAGGSGSANFNTASCNWSVTGAPSWITLSAATGTSSSFNFTIQPNPGATRQATLSINGGALSVSITQTGLVCTYTITDAQAGFGVSRSFLSNGGTGGISVVAPTGCPWTATSNQAFVRVSGNASGNGNGSVGYTVAANSSSNAQNGAIAIAGLAYIVNQQPPGAQLVSCSASSAGSALRPEGFAEKLGDLVLACSRAGISSSVTADVLVNFTNGVNHQVSVTNRLVSAGPTDALLLVDDPAAATLSLGTNAFRGVLSSVNGAGAILFPSVQLPSGSGGTFSHTLRIVNARVNTQGLGIGSTIQPNIVITSAAPFTISGQPTVGTVSPASSFSVPALTTVSGTITQPLSFTEGFATAFEPKLAAGQDPSQVNTIYNSESGYVNTAKLGAQTGFSTSGTRLIAAIANVPSGVSVYAPVAPASGTNAQLVSADAAGAGGSSVTGTPINGVNYQLINLIAGAGTATWEVTASDPNKIETLTFNLVLMNPGNASLTGINYAGALAPLSSGPSPQLPSTNLPVPRFASSTVSVKPLATVTLSVAPQPATQSQNAVLRPSLRSEASSPSAVGGTVTWTQVQANTGTAAGTSAAPNVSVGGTLPPSWVITNCTAVDSAGVCPTLNPNNLSGSYTVTYPFLSPGETGTIMLTAQSTSQTSGAVEYTSNIASDLANTDVGSGSFTANFPVSQIGLNVSLTHNSNFSQGQTGAQYIVTVSNGGNLPTSLPVTVTETLPTGLTLVSMSGTGWNCPAASSTCTRNDVLAGNSSYPSITVTVNVAANAPGLVTNQVTAATSVLQATGSDPTNITAGTGAPSAFFTGEASLGSSVYYLQFPNGNLFGYYNLSTFPIFYHYDLGFEAFADGGNGAAYMYDFTSGHWFYTNPALFPYLYDFALNAWLYYFADTKNPGHYTTNPRYFSNLTAGKIITM